MPQGPCGSLSSPALLRGNISQPQVGPQKTVLYLQRASSQHIISMQNPTHRCTMEYIHTWQRSFVTPVPLQICFFFNFPVSHPWGSCVVLWRSRRIVKGSEEQKKKKEHVCVVFVCKKEVEKESICFTTVSLENQLKRVREKSRQKLEYFGVLFSFKMVHWIRNRENRVWGLKLWEEIRRW